MSTQTAVFGSGLDAGVPWHHGDPLREQRVLATSAGVIDRSNRDVLVVPGEDRLPWLHSICSQHVENLADGDSTESLVLSPHGHVEQHWQLTELGETVWIDTEPGAGPTVLEYLQKMRFLKRVEPADVSEQWALLSLVGPRSADVLASAGLPVPEVGRAIAVSVGGPPASRSGGPPACGGVAGGGGGGGDAEGFVRGQAWPGTCSFDLLVRRGDAAATLQALAAAGAQPAGLWAFEALRIEGRRPRLGFETDHRTIPHEVGWIGPAVHLEKGCYRGQETVARVHNLGKPPRRLVLLHLSGESEELPPPGTPIQSGERAVGFLGTALHHHELGPIALAVIKRSLADDAHLSVGGAPVAIDPG